MIVGTAVIPSAPLLVPGVSATFPDGIEKVSAAVKAVLASLPPCDTVVLVAAAGSDAGGSGQGVYDVAEATLAGVGHPDVVRVAPTDRAAAERISRVSQYPMYRGDTLPTSLAVLALLVDGAAPFVPMAVPPNATFVALSATGAAIAEAFAGDREGTGGRAGASDPTGPRAIVIVAGDLSAALDQRSPLHMVEGAREWDARVVDVVDSGRLDALADLGPAEAARVGALGWAPLAVLHGAAARARVGLVRRHYSAPRGVGYLVAQGA